MAAAALLRSMVTKMARAPPPRLPSALEDHGPLSTSFNRLWLSRFSTSTGSTPPPPNIRGPQTHIKKVPSGSECKAKASFNDSASMATFFVVFGGSAFMYFCVIPALDRIQADLDAQLLAWVTIRERIEKNHERTRAILLSEKESQIEATYVSEGQNTGIGTK